MILDSDLRCVVVSDGIEWDDAEQCQSERTHWPDFSGQPHVWGMWNGSQKRVGERVGGESA